MIAKAEKSTKRGGHLPTLFSRVEGSLQILDGYFDRNEKGDLKRLSKHLSNICEILSEDYGFPLGEYEETFRRMETERGGVKLE